MKKQNIIYGIITVLIITGIYFIFNKNEKTEIKKIEKTEVLEIEKGKKTVKNVEVENEVSEKFIAKIATDNNMTEERVRKDLAEIKKEINKIYPNKNLKKIELISSKDIPDDFADIHNLPADPGPENDLTLLGVDSNENGIRDDMERVIAYSFRDYPELVAIHNTAEKMMTIDNKRYQEGDYSDESMEDSEKMSTSYVRCARYYREKKNLYSSIGSLGKKRFNTKERDEAENYHLDTNLYSLKTELQLKYNPVASEKFCQSFIDKYRK